MFSGRYPAMMPTDRIERGDRIDIEDLEDRTQGAPDKGR